jgi:hypothetical protein
MIFDIRHGGDNDIVKLHEKGGISVECCQPSMPPRNHPPRGIAWADSSISIGNINMIQLKWGQATV